MGILKVTNKWHSLPDAAKSSLMFAVSSFVVKGITFITTPVFTRIMNSSQYGIIAEYNSWLSIIEVFALLGMTSAGVFNVGLNDYKEKRDKYLSSVLILCNITTFCVFAAVFGICEFFLNSFIISKSLLLSMFIHFIFSPAMIFWITKQRYEYKYKAAFAVSILSAVISQISSVIGVICLSGNSAEIKIWCTTLSALLLQIPIYILIILRGKSFIDLSIWKSILLFALPLLPHYLAQHIMSAADKIMISDLYSESASGIYSVVANISMIAAIIWNAVNASLVPFSFEKLNQKKYGDINRIIIPLLIFYAMICFGVTLIAPEVLVILAPREYYSGIYAVPPIAAVSFVSALYNVYANIEFYYKKSSRIAMATIAAAAMNIALNFILIPEFGFIAAAYTTLISNFVLVVMHYIGYRKCQKERVYKDKLIFLITVISIASCLLSNLLYINDIFRYIIITAISIISIGSRKKIIKILHSLKMK